MKRFVLLALVASVLVATPAGAASAGADKTDVCHSEGNGSYHLINISENAFHQHLDHGDGGPGADVPGTDGALVFGENCVPQSAPDPCLLVAYPNETFPANSAILNGSVPDTDFSYQVRVFDSSVLFGPVHDGSQIYSYSADLSFTQQDGSTPSTTASWTVGDGGFGLSGAVAPGSSSNVSATVTQLTINTCESEQPG